MSCNQIILSTERLEGEVAGIREDCLEDEVKNHLLLGEKGRWWQKQEDPKLTSSHEYNWITWKFLHTPVINLNTDITNSQVKVEAKKCGALVWERNKIVASVGKRELWLWRSVRDAKMNLP